MTSVFIRPCHPFTPGSSRARIGGYLAITKVSALPIFHQIRLKPIKDARLNRAEEHKRTAARQHNSAAGRQQDGSRTAAGQIRTTTTLNTQVGDKARPFSEVRRSSEDRAIRDTRFLPSQIRSSSKNLEAFFRLRTPVGCGEKTARAEDLRQCRQES